MRSWKLTRWSVAGLVCGTAFVACDDDGAGPDGQVLVGSEIAVGAGLAWTELELDGSDRIRSLALVFGEDALDDLPPTLPNTEFVIPLPAGAPATVFSHVAINWQPEGHPPPMVYTVPHFDVHYYLATMEERNAMTPADPEFDAKGARLPTANEIPPGYEGDPVAIPRMGNHWTDRTSHEFHGQAFTNTMVYGFYDGRMVFMEPMMTLAFLEAHPDETRAMAVPAQYPEAGSYPTSYRVRFDEENAEFRVELLSFADRP